MNDKLILAGVCAVGLTAMVVSRCSFAELRVLDSQDRNPANTLSYLVGSIEASDTLSKGTFSFTNDGKTDNLNIAIERKSCDSGLGTVYFFDVADTEVLGKLGWVRGDGTMADVATDLLCSKFPAKPGKKASKTSF